MKNFHLSSKFGKTLGKMPILDILDKMTACAKVRGILDRKITKNKKLRQFYGIPPYLSHDIGKQVRERYGKV